MHNGCDNMGPSLRSPQGHPSPGIWQSQKWAVEGQAVIFYSSVNLPVKCCSSLGEKIAPHLDTSIVIVPVIQVAKHNSDLRQQDLFLACFFRNTLVGVK